MPSPAGDDASHTIGRIAATAYGTTTATVNITVAEPLAVEDAPTLVGEIWQRQANLSWEAVEGASKYRVRIRTVG